MGEKRQEGQTGEGEEISRIVVEFVGPGMAEVKRAGFENVSFGQMMAFAQWAQWQADQWMRRAEAQHQAEVERKAQLNQIIVPRGVPQ